MKANEAPEKIYISPLPNHSDGYVGVAWDEPHKTMVEYTRTDAFIENACDAYCKVCKMPNCRRNECKMIEDFKEYMSENRRREAHDQE